MKKLVVLLLFCAVPLPVSAAYFNPPTAAADPVGGECPENMRLFRDRCYACQSGYYLDTDPAIPGSVFCVTCFEGYYCVNHQLFSCPAGTYSPALSVGKESCRPCPEGTFNPTIQQAACSTVPEGTVAVDAAGNEVNAGAVAFKPKACTTDQYYDGQNFRPCPANAICNGSSEFSCKEGYRLTPAKKCEPNDETSQRAKNCCCSGL